MEWSKYQRDIYDAFEHTGDSLLIEAVAGSGKTTVLVELANVMKRAFPAQRAAFVAFNKAIADTLRERITAGNVQAMTLHSAGWNAWRRTGGLDWRPELEQHKVSRLIRECMDYGERKRYEEATRKLVSAAKGLGLVPEVSPLCSLDCGWMQFRGLVDDSAEVWDALLDHYSIDPDEVDLTLVRKVLARGIETARETCDFDDMLYMPVVAGVEFDRYDVVLVDEAQDLSGIQHEIVSRMVFSSTTNKGGALCEQAGESPATDACGGRVIAVGDRHQAIYAFRGAHSDSMDRLQARFQMRQLPLSVSYRCPRSVVQHARQWVPQIEWSDTAEDGVVLPEGTDWQGQCDIALGASLYVIAPESNVAEGISKWRGARDFHAGDAILCRLTRPLVAAAFTLIRQRIPCKVLGRDIAAGLVTLVKKAKSLQDARMEAFATWLDGYESRECDRLRKAGKYAQAGLLRDRCDTVRVFTGELEAKRGADATVQELIREIECIFADNGGLRGMVTLATVHKAKGAEWDRVFILDAGELMPCPWARHQWDRAQEENIAYVAATRPRRELRYIKSRDLLAF